MQFILSQQPIFELINFTIFHTLPILTIIDLFTTSYYQVCLTTLVIRSFFIIIRFPTLIFLDHIKTTFYHKLKKSTFSHFQIISSNHQSTITYHEFISFSYLQFLLYVLADFSIPILNISFYQTNLRILVLLETVFQTYIKFKYFLV